MVQVVKIVVNCGVSGVDIGSLDIYGIAGLNHMEIADFWCYFYSTFNVCAG